MSAGDPYCYVHGFNPCFCQKTAGFIATPFWDKTNPPWGGGSIGWTMETDEQRVAKIKELFREFKQLEERVKCECCQKHTTQIDRSRYEYLKNLLHGVFIA